MPFAGLLLTFSLPSPIVYCITGFSAKKIFIFSKVLAFYQYYLFYNNHFMDSFCMIIMLVIFVVVFLPEKMVETMKMELIFLSDLQTIITLSIKG